MSHFFDYEIHSIEFSASDCDSKCTFDVDCPFPQVCNNEECVMDSNVLWECGGVFSDPRLACKKRLINGM